MNRKCKVYRAISYGIIFYALLALLLLWKGKLLEHDTVQDTGMQLSDETLTVDMETQIQQVFLADGSYLRYLDFYALNPEARGEMFVLMIYDETNEICLWKEIMTPDTQIPGYMRIPVGIDTVPGRAYVWQLQTRRKPLELAVQDTASTGLTNLGYCYRVHDGAQEMFPAKNIPMHLVWTQKPSKLLMYGLSTGIVLLALALCAALYAASKKNKMLRDRVSLRYLTACTIGLTSTAAMAVLGWSAFIRRSFGGKREDLIVWLLGFIIAFLVLVLWIFQGTRVTARRSVYSFLEERGTQILQVVSVAGLLLGTTNYMNAQFQFQQDCAFRQVILWLLLLILSINPADALFTRLQLGTLIISGLLGFAYYQLRLFTYTGEKIELDCVFWRYDITAAIMILLLAVTLAKRIYSKDFRMTTPYWPFAGVLSAFLISILIFSNGRGWTWALVLLYGTFYVFFLAWEERGNFLTNLSNGVVLNFALAVVFAFLRRPFRAFQFTRYNFIFHTVTVTATYLTLVLGVLTVRVMESLNTELKGSSSFLYHYRNQKKGGLLGNLVLYGIAMSMLFMTLSRTGYLAVVVMTIFMLPFIGLVCQRIRFSALAGRAAVMMAAFLLMIPVTFTALRLIPAVYNDPYIYEVEDSAAAIHHDDAKNSAAYMSMSYFKFVLQEKLEFGTTGASAMNELKETVTELQAAVTHEVKVLPTVRLEASAGYPDYAPKEDISNGRLTIFKCYIQEWNLFGHEEMGVLLPDGATSVHAHNTYLQVIHDHGLLAGILFLLVGGFAFVRMLIMAVNRREESYTAMPLAILMGFAVAGLVEWLFHPCNPIGSVTLLCFAPLLYYTKTKTR